jgi:hypothetical protein
MEYLDVAGAKYRQLVTDELELLAVSSFADSTMPSARTCFLRFQGRERSSPVYLASHLVWAAAFMRLLHSTNNEGRKLDRRALDSMSAVEQLRFLEAVGEDAPWVESIRARAQKSTAA